MAFKFLPNLTAQSVESCDPWESAYVRPQLEDKEAFRVWCNNPLTQHAFISAAVGLQPALRISETNPATHLTGLVLDYDAVPPGPPAPILLTAAPAGLLPAYVSRSFSGNCRVLYVFEATIPLFAPDIAKEFLKKVARELKLRKLLAGFEVEAMLDLSKYYEIGEDWQPVGDGTSRISLTLLNSWMADACKKHRWDKEGPAIDVAVIRAEGEKRFAGKWPGGWGEFDLGVRGPRFWDESATDPTAALIRESGVQYFSDGGGFMRWEQIFGADFVRQWSDNRKGVAITGTWYDGGQYWQKLPGGMWAPSIRADVVLDLVVDKRLLSRSTQQNAPSETDSALHSIQKLNRVQRAMPFIYRPDGIHQYNGNRYLNISTVRPIMPVADLVTVFGEGFPWLAEFLYTLFDPNDQLDFFLSWLKHFYMGAVTQDPCRGLALFIAGPVGAGKTVLNKAILGQLMGSRQDAGKFLLGSDQFNDQLFGSALWNVDDEVVANDYKQRATFTQMVKKIVANDSFTYRAMYKSGEDLEWIGRIVVTLNNDPESLQMLPETDRNILDKIMLLLVKQPEVTYWPTDAQIAAELPFLGAFLRDFVMPAHCAPENPRFGVLPYTHEGLVHSAESTSTNASFEELLLIWRKEYFAEGGPGANEPLWVGNPTSFHQALAGNESLRPVLDKSFANTTNIGMHLNKLIRRGASYITCPTRRVYAISRPQ